MSQNIPLTSTPAETEVPSTAGMTTKVVKGSFWSFLGQVLPLGVTLFTTPFVIRLLGPESYGALVLINLITVYFSFADLGMNVGSTRFASEAYAAGARADEGKIVRTAALIAFLFALPLAIALFLLSLPVAKFLQVPEYLWPQADIALKIAAFSFVFTLLANIFNSPQVSRLRMDVSLVINTVFRVLGVGAALLAIYLGWGLPGAIAATAAAALLTLAGHILASGRLLPELYGLTIKRESIGPLLKFGVAMFASSVAILLLVNLEKMVLARVVSVKALAYYSVAFVFANAAVLFAGSMTQALLPAFTQLLRPEKKEELNLLFTRFLRINLIFLFPGLIMMFVLARPFFTLWAGEEFGSESTLPFYILLCGLFFNIIAYIPQSLLVASGRASLLAKVYWIELVPYIALVTLLTSFYGIAGAAVAWSLRVFIDAIVIVALTYKTIGLRPPDLRQSALSLALVIFIGLIPLLSMFVFGNINATFLTGIAFLIAYFTIVWRSFLTVEEKLWALAIFKRS